MDPVPRLRFGLGFFGPRRLRNIRCTGTFAATSLSTEATSSAPWIDNRGQAAGGTAFIIPG